MQQAPNPNATHSQVGRQPTTCKYNNSLCTPEKNWICDSALSIQHSLDNTPSKGMCLWIDQTIDSQWENLRLPAQQLEQHWRVRLFEYSPFSNTSFWIPTQQRNGERQDNAHVRSLDTACGRSDQPKYDFIMRYRSHTPNSEYYMYVGVQDRTVTTAGSWNRNDRTTCTWYHTR